ncbi:MAG: 50S ribosomal protein L24 [Dehalococcoidia bacterium]|nr:50S ribosomal protein L24 [Dehalococcoidia bacterium]
MTWKIHKGDTVHILSGKDRGKQGKVMRVVTKEGRLVVEGLNIVKKHQGKQSGTRQVGVIRMEAPMSASKVALVCPRCSKRARVGFRFLEDGRKVRTCHKCHETVD